jgi:hypothetical protein
MNRKLTILLLIAVFAAAIGTVYSSKTKAQAPPTFTVTLPSGIHIKVRGLTYTPGTRSIVLHDEPRIFSGSFE